MTPLIYLHYYINKEKRKKKSNLIDLKSQDYLKCLNMVFLYAIAFSPFSMNLLIFNLKQRGEKDRV